MADWKRRDYLHKLCASKYLQELKSFLKDEHEKELLINMPCSGLSGNSSLHEAVRLNNHNALQVLLSYGGHVDARAKGGYTPLHISAVLGNIECIKVLLKFSADMSLTDNFGNTPYKLAKQTRKQRAAKYLKTEGMLLERKFLKGCCRNPLCVKVVFQISTEYRILKNLRNKVILICLMGLICYNIL